MIRIRITRRLLTTHGHDASHVPHFCDLSRGQDFFARQEPALPARRRVLIRLEFPLRELEDECSPHEYSNSLTP